MRRTPPGLVVLDRRVRGDPDDDAVALPQWSVERRHQRPVRAGVGAEHLAELGGLELRERSHRQGAEGAGVEHEQVEAAEVGDDVDQGGAVVGVGDVAGDAVDRGAFEAVAQPVCIAGIGHHDPAGVVEEPAEGEAESGRSSGDDGYGVVSFV